MTEGKGARQGFWERPEVDRSGLRWFALTMAVALAGIGLWSWWREVLSAALWLWGAAGLLLSIGLLLPAILTPLYVVWMYLARVLGWINTHLLLGLVFYLLFTPIGGIMRLVGYDPLNRKWDPSQSSSYWDKPDQSRLSGKHYERQF